MKEKYQSIAIPPPGTRASPWLPASGWGQLTEVRTRSDCPPQGQGLTVRPQTAAAGAAGSSPALP